ncbi:MAG: hypothetical protein JWR80_6357 [Bradyrhizobium sp.]|nr:hypothetical protein [Bradyrhizobium sp.]
MQNFVPEDLLQYKTIDEVQGSPNADVALCEVQSVDAEANTYRTAIWQVAVSEEPVKLTAGTSSDSQPRWSPDGNRIAFCSDRAEGLPQVFIIPRNGGEAEQVTHFKAGVVMAEWHPSGTRMLVTCPVSVDPEARGARADEPTSMAKDAPRLVWRLPYKVDGIGYTLDREIHMFVVNLETRKSSQLTDGPFDVRTAYWSPDGKRIAFVRTREGRLAHRTDVWVCDSDGGNPRQLSMEQASVQSPKWSPDGRWILFAGSANEGDAQTRLWLIDLENGSAKPLGADSLEIVSGDSAVWASDSRSIFVLRAYRGLQQIAKISVPDGKVETVVDGDRHISSFGLTQRRIYFVTENPAEPQEVWSSSLGGGSEVCASSWNGWWKGRPGVHCERRSFTVPNGDGATEHVEGWVVRATARSGDPRC